MSNLLWNSQGELKNDNITYDNSISTIIHNYNMYTNNIPIVNINEQSNDIDQFFVPIIKNYKSNTDFTLS